MSKDPAVPDRARTHSRLVIILSVINWAVLRIAFGFYYTTVNLSVAHLTLSSFVPGVQNEEDIQCY